MSEYTTARAQYVKVKRAEVRMKFSLMADAEIAESIDQWKLDFEVAARENAPVMLSFENAVQAELRKLTSGQ